MSSSRLLLSASNLISRSIRHSKRFVNNRDCGLKSVESYSQFRRTMARTSKHFLTIDKVNPNIKVMEYAIRGPLVIRAAQIEKELEQGVKKPFNEVIRANNGDCHAMGQRPITFIRQVLALVSYPALMDNPDFPDDVKAKAKAILKGCRGSSMGSYTESPGIEIIRRHVADYIERRDGYPCVWENISLCSGATGGIKTLLELLVAEVDGKKPGVMIPIPQYPLYSATLAQFNIQQIDYYLDESNNWALSVEELGRAIDEAKETCNPCAIVIINPGNPTGQVLTKKNIQEIIKFSYEKELFLFADEVYQHNIYDENSKFHSFKKVMMEMGPPYSEMELASFMSASKGYMGECGVRGGYIEIINVDPRVKAMYLKSISANVCPTVYGQAAIDCVVNPPKPGEPSYDLYFKEKTQVLDSLKQRAKMVEETFNSIEGMSCNPAQGAMYAFPQIALPPMAHEKAKLANQAPCAYYAFQLLEQTGICVIPGSGFGQKEGTYHFRTTILPEPEKLKLMLENFKSFHEKFLKEHR